MWLCREGQLQLPSTIYPLQLMQYLDVFLQLQHSELMVHTVCVNTMFLHLSQPFKYNFMSNHRTHRNEIAFEPSIIFDGIKAGELTTRHVDHAVVHIWILGGWVVSPDDHIPHMSGRNTTAHRHLKDRGDLHFRISQYKEMEKPKCNMLTQVFNRSAPENEPCCGPGGWGRRSFLWGWREQIWLQSDS